MEHWCFCASDQCNKNSCYGLNPNSRSSSKRRQYFFDTYWSADASPSANYFYSVSVLLSLIALVLLLLPLPVALVIWRKKNTFVSFWLLNITEIDFCKCFFFYFSFITPTTLLQSSPFQCPHFSGKGCPFQMPLFYLHLLADFYLFPAICSEVKQRLPS